MNTDLMDAITATRRSQWAVAAHEVPWVPLGEGKAFKPLCFLPDDAGFVELLRLEPGVELPLHRHTGEVHAFNLEGWRELHTGERIGPGGYVNEPPGNVDSWRAIGAHALVVLVVAYGAVEYLDPSTREVRQRYTADTLKRIYDEYCSAQGGLASAG